MNDRQLELQFLNDMKTLLPEPEPATSPTAMSAAAPRPLNLVEMRARILYVEDDPQLRSLGKLVLARSGYEVDTAADGAEGWAALHDVSYNLLITDHDMPRVTGLELITQARRAGMRLPIVLTSGSSELLREPDHLGTDLAVFLAKPFAVDKLLQTVEQLLQTANQGRCLNDGPIISGLVRQARVAQSIRHFGINE